MATRQFTQVEKDAIAAALAEGLAIQHKFRPEPVYKHTGKGYMKSDGVAELQKIKEQSSGKNVAS
jgi:hypothetical protein